MSVIIIIIDLDDGMVVLRRIIDEKIMKEICKL